jgi:predicted porin
MKIYGITFASAAMLLCVQAHAEAISGSSVSIFGLLDAGVSYVSNEGGNKNVKFDDGIAVPNLFGFTGREDLGGGMAAIFKLTDQFSLGTGSIVQGAGNLFGREAYVGLSDDRWGRLTFGNQYDFMTDALFFSKSDAAIYVGGFYNFRAGPFEKLQLPYAPPFAGSFDWDRMAGIAIANSVKYASPTFGGFHFGAMYAFGGQPGSIGADNSVSFGLNYNADAFGAAAAYTNVKYGVAGSVQNWGVGANYALDSWNMSALLTTVRVEKTGAAVAEVEVGAGYRVATAWLLSADYMYMKGDAYLNDNHAHQLTANVSYDFSKRTTVYVEGVYQRANSGANALVNGVLDAPVSMSSSPTQAIARVAVTTRF